VLITHFWWEFLWDKAAHAGAYGALALAWLIPYGLHYPQQHPGSRNTLLILLASFLYGSLLEVAQGMFTERVFDFADMLANITGGLLAYLAYFIYRKRTTTKSKQ